MHNKLDYKAILKYFTHNEWKYIIEVIDREYHDFGHNELNRSVSNKLDKLTSKLDNQNEEETIIVNVQPFQAGIHPEEVRNNS